MHWRQKAIQLVQEGGYTQIELADACGIKEDRMRGWLDRASIPYPIYCDPESKPGRSPSKRFYMLPFRYDVVAYEKIRIGKGDGWILEPTAEQRIIRT